MTQKSANNGCVLLSLKDASRYSGLPVHELRKAIIESELPFLRTTERARKMYVPRDGLDRWISKCLQTVR